MNGAETSASSTRNRRARRPFRGAETKMYVLELAERMGNVSRACAIVGFSRDSFYRFKKMYEEGGVSALERPVRRGAMLKNRVAPEIEEGVIQLSLAHPKWGREKVSETLAQRNLKISPSGVRCVWLRHELQTSTLRLEASRRRSATEPPQSSAQATTPVVNVPVPLLAANG